MTAGGSRQFSEGLLRKTIQPGAWGDPTTESRPFWDHPGLSQNP